MSYFYYEHIGHMHVSKITLDLFEVIIAATNQHSQLIEVEQLIDRLMMKGYKRASIESEIERFYYGFSCREIRQENTKYLSLTKVGQMLIDGITKAIYLPRNQFAFIIRNARRKDCVNVTIQETTYFSSAIYNLIDTYGFRAGGTRAFLKCMDIKLFINFMSELLEALNAQYNSDVADISDCIEEVEKYGISRNNSQYKYIWLSFKQRFELFLNEREWTDYAGIISAAHHPVEWGGRAVDLTYENLLDINPEIDVNTYLESGIIRNLYDTTDKSASYRLTVPGFVMWQRKDRGFLLEVLLTRQDTDSYCTEICDASDRSDYYTVLSSNQKPETKTGNFSDTLDYLYHQIVSYKNHLEGHV